jgi:hypothetical protein
VSTSINRNGFYPFLLDTGSEPTLMTSGGLSRARLLSSNKIAPQKVTGIGESSVVWGRLGEVSLGIGGFGVSFKDLLVHENDAAFENGIIGTSYLKNFRARLELDLMTLGLDRRP